MTVLRCMLALALLVTLQLFPSSILLSPSSTCLLQVSAQTQAPQTFSCGPANRTAMPFCGSVRESRIGSNHACLFPCANFCCVARWLSDISDYVDYLIANDTIAEDYATYDFQAAEQHARDCSFFAYKPFACSQWFPRCVNTTAGGVGTIQGICQDYCLQANDVKECTDYHSEVQIRIQICGDAKRITAAPAACVGADLLAPPEDVLDSKWWKIGLGAGIGVVVIITLACLWRRHKRENISEKELEKHDAEKTAKMQKKKNKEDAANAKKGSGKKKTNDNSQPQQLGRGRYEAPPEAAQNGAPLAVGDIEMGGLEGVRGAPVASSSAAHRHRSPDPPSASPVAIMSPPGNRRSLIVEQQQQPPSSAAAAATSSSKDHKSHKSEKKKSHKSDKDKDHKHHHHKSDKKSHVEAHGELSPITSPDDEALMSRADPVRVGGHITYGQQPEENAWKSGMPTRVAPPGGS
jgi:hypothetical protein